MNSLDRHIRRYQVADEGYSYKKVVAWMLLLTSGFGFVLLNFTGLRYLFFAIVAYYVYRSWSKPVVDKKWMLVYALAILGSCIYSYIYNGQNPVKVFVNSYAYLGIFSIFLLYYYAPTYKQATRAIVVLSVIWCVCYLVQWAIYPVTLFESGSDDTNISDDFFRMRLPGSICAYCLFLYGVNRWVTTKSPLYLAYSVLGIIPIFIMGFRSLTAAVVVCAFIMIAASSKNVWRTILWAALAALLGYWALDIPIIGDKLEEMIERNDNDQTFDNEDYIRYIEYDYFTQEFFTKPGEKFFGGGFPVNGNSAYADKLNIAEERFGYYWVDLGLVGLTWIIGVPAVVCLIILLWKGVKHCRGPENQYIRFTIIATTLASVFTSMEIYRDGNLLIVGLYLYTIAAYNRENPAPVKHKSEKTTRKRHANRIAHLSPGA